LPAPSLDVYGIHTELGVTEHRKHAHDNVNKYATQEISFDHVFDKK